MPLTVTGQGIPLNVFIAIIQQALVHCLSTLTTFIWTTPPTNCYLITTNTCISVR